jgi:hypothetical protein
MRDRKKRRRNNYAYDITCSINQTTASSVIQEKIIKIKRIPLLILLYTPLETITLPLIYDLYVFMAHAYVQIEKKTINSLKLLIGTPNAHVLCAFVTCILAI